MKITHIIASGVLAILFAQPAIAQVEFLNSGKVVKGSLPFSEAVKDDGTLYLSGQVGLDPATQELVPGGIRSESRQMMENIIDVLEAHGYSIKDVVKCTAFLADMKEFASFNDVYKGYFKNGKYPTRSTVGVSSLAMGARVEVECIASK